MNENDIRWKQRFSNYKKALQKLQDALREYENEMSDHEKEGMIQRFEYTFELAWKTLQDLLYERGYMDIKGPTLVLRQALQNGYIEGEEKWRLMKNARELTSHTYDEHTVNKIAEKIKEDYCELLFALKTRLYEELLK